MAQPIVKPDYKMSRVKDGWISGGIRFTCSRCPYEVITYHFDPRKGNLRTQAAKVMNLHVRSTHPQQQNPNSF